MITLAILPHEGVEESSEPFASNDAKYQDYIKYLENKYSNESVEYAYIIEGTEKARRLVFDRIPMEARRFTNFEQFLNVARGKKF